MAQMEWNEAFAQSASFQTGACRDAWRSVCRSSFKNIDTERGKKDGRADRHNATRAMTEMKKNKNKKEGKAGVLEILSRRQLSPVCFVCEHVPIWYLHLWCYRTLLDKHLFPTPMGRVSYRWALFVQWPSTEQPCTSSSPWRVVFPTRPRKFNKDSLSRVKKGRSRYGHILPLACFKPD